MAAIGGDIEKEKDDDHTPDIRVLRQRTSSIVTKLAPLSVLDYFGTFFTLEERQNIEREDDRKGSIAGMRKMLNLMVFKPNFLDAFFKVLSHEDHDGRYNHILQPLKEDYEKELEKDAICEEICGTVCEASSGEGDQAVPSPRTSFRDLHLDDRDTTKVKDICCNGDRMSGLSNGNQGNQKTLYLDQEQTSPKDVDISTQNDGQEQTSPKDTEISPRNYDVTNRNYSSNSEKLRPSGFKPREYQEELATRPNKGENCIICAPTNSGKTFVATMITSHHLSRWDMADAPDNPPRVIVLVPRVALLQQVFRDFRSHLPLVCVGKRGGGSASKQSFRALASANDVLIVTADILRNALRDESVDLNYFTLIIFDECHHTMNDHSYNDIMERYVLAKGDPNLCNSLPQIVGLTASPSAGKKVTVEDAKQSILRLCANMDISAFVTVQNHTEELAQYTSRPSRERRRVTERPNNPFRDLVSDWMAALEREAGFGSSPCIATQMYETYVVEFRTASLSQNRFDEVKVCDHLIEINKALMMSEVARMRDGLRILSEFYGDLERRKEKGKLTKKENLLLQYFSDNKTGLERAAGEEELYPNPKLKDLRDCILSHRDSRQHHNRKLRVMVFVKTKLTVIALLEWMKEDVVLRDLNPAQFTGVRADSEKGGMSVQEQKTVLKKFHDGDLQVLISTSVGEEGIDIPECSLVIRYCHVTNEISMIQSRGRVRQSHGNEVILGEAGTMEKDSHNLLLEEVLLEAKAQVTAMPASELRVSNEKIQKDAKAERKAKNRRKEEREKENDAKDVELFCKGCPKEKAQRVCLASDIRLFKNNNHILPESFRSLVREEDRPAKDDRKYKKKKIFCKQCGYDWGNAAGGYKRYPCLKIKSFFCIIDGQPKTFKQWNQVPFKIKCFEDSPDTF